MAPRSSWKGYLKISLVSLPVKAYTGSSSGGSPISLNQLHEKCHSRIRYRKVCPIHGEVPNDEIVSGYEYSKDQYVVIDTDELEKLRSETDHSVNVDSFVPSDSIDPALLTGKTYYLLPDGPVGQKPYQLIQDAMSGGNLHAIATVVLSKREQIVRIRPREGLLAMDVLEYKTQVKDPTSFQDELVETTLSAQEKKLTKQLIDALAKKKFDPSEYKDLYTERLTQLIEARVQGEELVTAPAEEEPQVINLMEALKQSVKDAGGKTAKPSRRRAASSKSTRASSSRKSTKKKSG
ncbi:non-homologous end joining protein Ku [Rubinisphaera margarita]|uniref:non-homologous end joining protein Ku n=1 Tax=Rubinisphaera margarita TaxID=2909586 RepID=UPI001EE79099|nr:Ku protein [Rubinisphaera margarita]MCG6156689.1 Ku protein [Rubinisphaera margarita]